MSRSDQSEHGDEDPVATVETGRRGQRLICEGWFASHADSGTPGPHVRLRTSDGEEAVLRTDQLAALGEALEQVSTRIERPWQRDGEQYAREVVLSSPDPQDPREVDRRRRNRLRFTQAVHDHLDQVTRLLLSADSTDEALDAIADALDVEPTDVMVGLARFDLLSLTRPATQRRLTLLAETEA